jgi:hypothetical protein
MAWHLMLQPYHLLLTLQHMLLVCHAVQHLTQCLRLPACGPTSLSVWKGLLPQ